VNKFDREIASAVRSENRRFDMRRFQTRRSGIRCRVATCKTATCLAGHIVALRRKLATALMDLHPEVYTYKSYRQGYYHKGTYVPSEPVATPKYATLAAAIYQIETGKECDLGFFGTYCSSAGLETITREDALLHLAGKHPTWPRNRDIRAGY
jgi:hypothetical protein